jgi:hypothetical protein
VAISIDEAKKVRAVAAAKRPSHPVSERALINRCRWDVLNGLARRDADEYVILRRTRSLSEELEYGPHCLIIGGPYPAPCRKLGIRDLAAFARGLGMLRSYETLVSARSEESNNA